MLKQILTHTRAANYKHKNGYECLLMLYNITSQKIVNKFIAMNYFWTSIYVTNNKVRSFILTIDVHVVVEHLQEERTVIMLSNTKKKIT